MLASAVEDDLKVLTGRLSALHPRFSWPTIHIRRVGDIPHGINQSSKMLKISASIVLASLSGSTYDTKYDSPLRSLRP